MKSILHRIAHYLRWNHDYVDAYYEKGILMMSFVCSGCGKRSNIHEVPFY